MASVDSSSGLWGQVMYDADGNRVTSTTQPRTASSELDKNAFLKLLMTQMQYQDPLNPTDDKQFLAQMAQFSAMEQMQNMAASTQESSAFALIGKYVDAIDYNSTTLSYEQVTGLVSSVLKVGSELYLKIGEKDVRASSVVEVFPDLASAQIGSINTGVLTSQNIALIGKCVQAITLDSDGKAKEFIEGVVEYVKFDSDNTPVLVVGGKEVYGAEVLSVSEKEMLLGQEVYYEEHNSETKETDSKSGKIDSIKLKDDKAYLVLDNKKEIEISKINYVTEALNYVGKDIKHNNESAKVDGIVLIDGFPYFKMGDNVLSYLTYKGISA